MCHTDRVACLGQKIPAQERSRDIGEHEVERELSGGSLKREETRSFAMNGNWRILCSLKAYTKVTSAPDPEG